MDMDKIIRNRGTEKNKEELGRLKIEVDKYIAKNRRLLY